MLDDAFKENITEKKICERIFLFYKMRKLIKCMNTVARIFICCIKLIPVRSNSPGLCFIIKVKERQGYLVVD